MRNEVSQKSPPANGRGRTHNNPMREGRAPENKSSDVVTLSNREGAGGFSKRRERETKDDDDHRDEKQKRRVLRDSIQRALDDEQQCKMYGLHEKTSLPQCDV